LKRKTLIEIVQFLPGFASATDELSSSASALVTETDSFSLFELVSGFVVVVVVEVVGLELELDGSPSSPTVSSSPHSSFLGGDVGFFA
jgi:hypothetical protein